MSALDRHAVPTGVGLGLRWDFLREVLAGKAAGKVRFFELVPENYACRGDFLREAVEQVAASGTPLLSHGVSLSLGGSDALDADLLGDLREVLALCQVPWHSDHLCFTSHAGEQLHELLPIPWTQAVAVRTAERIARVSDALKLPMLVENVTYYAHAKEPELAETAFIREVLTRADCGLLLDLNNVHVNAHNHGFCPWEWLAQIPLERVAQIHVAGPEVFDGDYLVDTHGSPVPERVREMLAWTLERTGPVPVLLERDNAIPSFDALLDEVAALQVIYDAAMLRMTRKAG